MENDTQDIEQPVIEIMPPEPRGCALANAVLCPCCQRLFVREPEDYGICRQCIECL